MDSGAPGFPAIADNDSRRRARERLYVVCQLAGWTFFLVMQLLFSGLFREQDSAGVEWGILQTVAEGLLITHYTRRWLTKWGWKELSWRPLIPRILGMAVLLSIVWSSVGYGIYYGLLRSPWPHKYHPAAVLSVSLFNGTVLMAGWLCIYFFYHLFDRYNRLQIEQLRLTSERQGGRAARAQVADQPAFHLQFAQFAARAHRREPRPGPPGRHAAGQPAALLAAVGPARDRAVRGRAADGQRLSRARTGAARGTAAGAARDRAGRARPVRFRRCCCRRWWRTRSSTGSPRGARAARSRSSRGASATSFASRSPIPGSLAAGGGSTGRRPAQRRRAAAAALRRPGHARAARGSAGPGRRRRGGPPRRGNGPGGPGSVRAANPG